MAKTGERGDKLEKLRLSGGKRFDIRMPAAGQHEQSKQTATCEPAATDAPAQVMQCMRRGTRGAPDESTWDEYKTELVRLVDEFGEEFVCDHACERLREAGTACRDGSCAQRSAYGGDTCHDACRSFIEVFLSDPAPVFRKP
jgi:hypothetical protein